MDLYPGVSGMALYVPKLRIQLKDWCDWNQQPWEKVRSVVGSSYRVRSPHESIYTMAANAVLRLLLNYDVDPESVGFLGFGTESSTDNSAGAVIIKGMVNRGLTQLRRGPLSRNCEVPEFKHACLGGMYALKGALRYLAYDGRGRRAIVVCADIAEYERGSSGEQTQGAGAVAMLLEAQPKLFSVDLHASGSTSDYRAVDFRKPIARHFMAGYAEQRFHDFPVFNGRYSTYCYLDEVRAAVDQMAERSGRDDYLDDTAAVLFHRPYHHMSIQGLAWLYLQQLARTESPRLRELAELAGADHARACMELSGAQDLLEFITEQGIAADPTPEASKIAKVLRKQESFQKLSDEKTNLGSGLTRQFGNLYSASLPAWIGAALEDGARRGAALSGKEILTVGYGSGDAAEAIPIRPVEGWERAADRLGFTEALKGAQDLSQAQYEALHDGRAVQLDVEPKSEFIVERVGESSTGPLQDIGIEYYRYVP